MNYTSDLQWLSAKMAGAPYDWGLFMTYESGKVVSALQNTGCPPGACPPSTFTYTSARILSKAACFAATRQEHVAAGRAFALKGYVYAKGSEKFLGSQELRDVVPLRERSAGKFYFDPACR